MRIREERIEEGFTCEIICEFKWFFLSAVAVVAVAVVG